MISIRSKLSLWLTGLVVIATIVALVFFESMLRQAFHDSIIARLQEDLQQVLLATHIEDGSLSIDQTQLSNFYKPVYSGRYYQLDLPEQELRSRSLWDQRLEVADLKEGETRAWQTKGPQNHDIQLLSIGLNSDTSGLNATLTVAQDLSIGRKIVSEIYGTKLIVNLVMLMAMIMGIFLVLRQSFKPVSQMKDTLARLREGEISSFDLNTIPLELQPLASNYNELLLYSSKQIERSRNNLGNLSHGLKTPLAVMQQQVEVLGLKDPDSAEALQKQLDLVHKMIERKLAAARITGDMLPAAQMQLPKDIEDLVQTLKKVHRTKTINCRLDIPADIRRLPMHREDGMELLGNLLDNAFKWADTEIRVCISNHDQQLIISIEDDGPGVKTEELALLTHRGKRLDEATMGHGLGLSIVKDIAEQYKIVLQFQHSLSLSGLKVTLHFSV
ncbi:two-component sensor histidine kinase [Shewanella sp. Choline-02u-19]|uniref:ATP-binding protein n=1 Tax=unclassified Shewanella TaxID=196818 RepID=UPI000C32CD5E|nr:MULTISPECIES: ATP-binding protein [unclassified Shewanella]PKH55467.1 two-component sensor histidine kinase [Shewanella sp. Bg11-22]PKI28814.1 two-component sensor histidine kinase [Shewanella sp. Choline-02u-19]